MCVCARARAREDSAIGARRRRPAANGPSPCVFSTGRPRRPRPALSKNLSLDCSQTTGYSQATGWTAGRPRRPGPARWKTRRRKGAAAAAPMAPCGERPRRPPGACMGARGGARANTRTHARTRARTHTHTAHARTHARTHVHTHTHTKRDLLLSHGGLRAHRHAQVRALSLLRRALYILLALL